MTFEQIHSRPTPKHLRPGGENHRRPKGKLRLVSDTGVPPRDALEKMKVADLREVCLGRGIPINSKLKKKQLIEMLVGR